MWARLKKTVSGLNLAQRFTLAGFCIVTVGGMVVAGWVGRQIEARILNETATRAQFMADNLIAPYLVGPPEAARIAPREVESLDNAMAIMRRGHQIIALDVWDARGRLLYSNPPAQTGQAFPVHDELARALQGERVPSITDVQHTGSADTRRLSDRLLETYVPMRLSGSDTVVAVAEFYEDGRHLQEEIAAAQWQTWLAIAAVMLTMYLLLVQFVRRTSQTITGQQMELKVRMTELTMMLERNEALNIQMQRASASVATINEQFLRRIGTELHDGLAQELSLALLRLDRVEAFCEASPVDESGRGEILQELDTIQLSLQQGLREARDLSSGLMLPQLDGLTISETLAAVVRAHERRTGSRVELSTRDLPEQAPLPVQVTIYRFVQEGLSNAFRHASGAGQRVRAYVDDGRLIVGVSDQGGGFDPNQVARDGEHLGLIGMRERVESLGGSFCIDTETGAGTSIFASVPLEFKTSEAS